MMLRSLLLVVLLVVLPCVATSTVVPRYAPPIAGERSTKDKAILVVITTHGRADAAMRAEHWSLNDSGARR